MASVKKLSVHIALTIALIWNDCRGMPSYVESDCEFDSQMTYNESSDCPNGATGLKLCEPGQMRIRPCISADEDTTNICEPCPPKLFQAYFSRCTNCHQCSDCGTNERVQTHCTNTSDTDCISINTKPTTTSKGSTIAAESEVITENKGPGQNFVPDYGSSLDRLHEALIVACVALIWVSLAVTANMVLLALMGCLLRKSKFFSWLRDQTQRNNKRTPGANQASSSGHGGDGGTDADNKRQDPENPQAPSNGGGSDKHNASTLSFSSPDEGQSLIGINGADSESQL